MKTLSALVVAGFLVQSAAAQQPATVLPTGKLYNTGTVSTAQVQSPQATLDTLSQYLDRATNNEITVYEYPVNETVNLPVTGTNTLYLFLGAKYTVSQQATVKGLLVAYAGKAVNGAPDEYAAVVFAAGENGLPTSSLGTASFTTNDIAVPTEQQIMLTYIPFTTATVVSGNFAVAVQTLSGGEEPDLVAIFSNQQGDGQGEDRGFFLTQQNQSLVAGHLSQLPVTFAGEAIDLDPIIMPVIETGAATGVHEYATVGGLTLKGAYPNPATDRSTVRFALDQPSFVELSVVDMAGRTLLTVRRDHMEAGEHAVELNLADLPAGSYLYTVRTAATGLAGSMTVVK